MSNFQTRHWGKSEMLREFSLSLTFVALLLAGYTAMMMNFAKPVEAKHTDTHLELRSDGRDVKTEARLHSRTEASVKSVLDPAAEAASQAN